MSYVALQQNVAYTTQNPRNVQYGKQTYGETLCSILQSKLSSTKN